MTDTTDVFSDAALPPLSPVSDRTIRVGVSRLSDVAEVGHEPVRCRTVFALKML